MTAFKPCWTTRGNVVLVSYYYVLQTSSLLSASHKN